MVKILMTRKSLIHLHASERYIYEFPKKFFPKYFYPIHFELNKKGIKYSLDFSERLEYTYIIFFTKYIKDFVQEEYSIKTSYSFLQ